MKFGYALSSEEHKPNDLVRYARMAEEYGFDFALISDHYHPWIDAQGQSSFVWSVLGAIAHSTERLRVGTGVTCPTIRIHPAVIAQAAATVEAMMPGRFFLGVGSGENLNEHITGERWPNVDERQAMLREAIEIIRELWSGEKVDFVGEFYRVQDARIYTLPPSSPPIYVAASGQAAARIASEMGDGLIATSPDEKVMQAYTKDNAVANPRYGQITVCWAESEAEARKTAYEFWPNAAIRGELSAELPQPGHFEQAAKMVGEDDVAEAIVCGPDPQRHIERLKEYAEAGFDHIYFHQVGPDQEGFFRFYAEQVLPHIQARDAA